MTTHPPERFHVFVSYTTRENEVQIIKPLVDHFLQTVLRPVIAQTIGEPPIFYDGYTLHYLSRPWFSDFELIRSLTFAIEESEVLLAFLSPEYFGSRWCKFEFSTMLSKEFRPWFDLCREAPIPELRDQRPQRPGWWRCLDFKSQMRHWRRTNPPPREPGGAIVPIVLKGEMTVPLEMQRSPPTPLFDWRPCGSAFHASERVNNHLYRHGSVSPAWEDEAERLDTICHERMEETAFAIVEILRQRRLRYAQSASA